MSAWDDDDFELEPDSTQLKEKMASLGLESTAAAATADGTSIKNKENKEGEPSGEVKPERKSDEETKHTDRDEAKKKQLESNAELVQALFGIGAEVKKKEEEPQPKPAIDNESKREARDYEVKPPPKEEEPAATATTTSKPPPKRKKKQKGRLDEDMIEGDYDVYDEMMDRYR